MSEVSTGDLAEIIAELSPRERIAIAALLRERASKGTSDLYVKMIAEMYDELPIPMGDFLYREDYLNLKGIIFPRVADLLVECDDPTIREVGLELGKGSGKSFIAGISMVRSVYRMLCLKSPHRYLGLDPVSSIAVLNLSIQGNQAERIIFKEFSARIERCPWFKKDGRSYRPRKSEILFSKDIIACSGNSSQTSFLGYHTITGIMDEVNYFRDKGSGESVAENLVTMLRGSMQTRAPHDYKLYMISSVNTTDDYLTRFIQSVKDRGYEKPLERLGKDLPSLAI